MPENLLQPVYRSGQILRTEDWATITARAHEELKARVIDRVSVAAA